MLNQNTPFWRWTWKSPPKSHGLGLRDISMSFLEEFRLKVVLWYRADSLMLLGDSVKLLIIKALVQNAIDDPQLTLELAYKLLASNRWRGDCQSSGQVSLNLPFLLFKLPCKKEVLHRSLLPADVHVATVPSMNVAWEVSSRIWNLLGQSWCHCDVGCSYDVPQWLAQGLGLLLSPLKDVVVDWCGGYGINLTVCSIGWRSSCRDTLIIVYLVALKSLLNWLDLIHSRAPDCCCLSSFLFCMLIEAFNQACIDLIGAIRAQFLCCSNLVAKDGVASSLPVLVNRPILNDDLTSLGMLDSHAIRYSVQLKSVFEFGVLSLHL